jgi:fatty acid desaturase
MCFSYIFKIYFSIKRLDEAGSANIIRIILPDIVVLGLAIISLILCAKSIKAYVIIRKASQLGPKATDRTDGNGSQTVSINNELNTTTATVTQSTVPKLRRYQKSYMFTDNQAFRAAVLQQKKIKIKNQTKKFTNWLVKISFEILFLILLAISGGIWPSLLSIPYFILFLIIISYWSCMRQNILPPFLNQKLGTNTTIVTQQPQINNQVLVTPNTTTITNNNDQVSPPTNQQQPKAENDGCVLIEKAIKIFLLFYLALHILLLYIYQFNFFQSYSDKNSLTIRLLGLYAAITTRCDQPANFSFNQLKFQQITYPFILIIFYWILKFESAYIKNLKDENEVRVLLNRFFGLFNFKNFNKMLGF